MVLTLLLRNSQNSGTEIVSVFKHRLTDTYLHDMRYLICLLVFSSLGLVLAKAQTTNAGRSLSKAQADSTLTELHNALVKYHPFSYQGEGKQQLDSVASLLHSKIDREIVDSVLLGDFIGLVSPFSRLIGDGHLHLRIKAGKGTVGLGKRYFYALSTAQLSDSRFVLTDTLITADSLRLAPGTEVVSFAGVEMNQLVPLLGSFFGLNDHDNRKASEYYISRSIASFFQRTYGYRDSFQLEILQDRERQAVWIKPTLKAKSTKPTKEQRIERLLSLDTVRLDDVYKLDIRTFSSSQLKKVPEIKLLRQYFRKLNEQQAKGLIIDLRDNTGGAMSMVSLVYSYLTDNKYLLVDDVLAYDERAAGKNIFSKTGNYIFGGVRKRGGVYIMNDSKKLQKPKKAIRRFDGEVIVLVNEPTFSGGTTLAAYIQNSGRGKVVGQIPGGSAQQMFAAQLFKVPLGPNKELVLNMPLWYMDMTGNAKGNVIPDVLVRRTVEDYTSNRDAALEAALDLLEAELIDK